MLRRCFQPPAADALRRWRRGRACHGEHELNHPQTPLLPAPSPRGGPHSPPLAHLTLPEDPQTREGELAASQGGERMNNNSTTEKALLAGCNEVFEKASYISFGTKE